MTIQSFINVQDRHRKFYVVKCDTVNRRVTCIWGRLGSMGQTQVSRFLTATDTREFAEQKVDTRYAHGYTRIA